MFSSYKSVPPDRPQILADIFNQERHDSLVRVFLFMQKTQKQIEFESSSRRKAKLESLIKSHDKEIERKM